MAGGARRSQLQAGGRAHVAGQRKGGGGGKQARRQFPRWAASRGRGRCRGQRRRRAAKHTIEQDTLHLPQQAGRQVLRCGGAGRAGAHTSLRSCWRHRFRRQAVALPSRSSAGTAGICPPTLTGQKPPAPAPRSRLLYDLKALTSMCPRPSPGRARQPTNLFPRRTELPMVR